jgi:hypothetical protein
VLEVDPVVGRQVHHAQGTQVSGPDALAMVKRIIANMYGAIKWNDTATEREVRRWIADMNELHKVLLEKRADREVP